MATFARFVMFMALCGAWSAVYGQTAVAPRKCETKPITAIRIEKPEGWALDFIDKPIVLSTGKAPAVYGPGHEIVQTTLGLKESRIELPEIVVNPCDYTTTLTHLYLRVMQVKGFSQNGKTFAYVVTGAKMAGPEPGATEYGSATFVTFLDVSGNGKFEMMRTNGAPLPELPDWIR
jgi:hypothetical protein